MSLSHHLNNFEDILSSDIAIQRNCLDKLVEDINEIKEKTIYNFLNDSGSEDFLWSLLKLLSSDDLRLASNAAYVIGSFAETELGSERVLSITEGRKLSSIIQDLTAMLASDDSETVMNAAGTLGTLAETNNGRSWMLSQVCISETMSRITDLLSYENNWVASNAALVLARLSISEDGCKKLLSHEQSTHILAKLINSLGNDSAGRGMNAAFAIGRLLDTNEGKERLLNLPDTDKMISTLCRMLCKGDLGSGKNACFAVSCLAADKDGNHKVIANNLFNDVVSRLVVLLANEEDLEAAWFAAMTLRTLSSQQRGILRLRENEMVLTSLKKNFDKPANTKELNDEIAKTLENLKKLEAPDPPFVTLLGPTSARAEWGEVTLTSDAPVVYKLFEGSRLVYKGKESQVEFDDLKPNTSYNYKLKISAIGDDSPFSKVVTIATDEGCPSPPCNVRVVGSTSSQIRVCWDPPEQPNGALKGYNVYVGDKPVQHTTETSFIATKLQPATSYNIRIRALTNKGPGEDGRVGGRTHELGAHAPSKPTVTVIGRNEVHVTWNPPAVPLGRISRYELSANKDVIYSGTDRSYYATNLIPDKDYSFTVCAITNEGRCESEVTRKKTHKDKSQAEPGRHASKTHSFKAKEFQLEKSKTQSSIVVSKPKPKGKKRYNTPPRPTSCSSSSSHTSSYDKASSPVQQDGSWAATNSGSASTDIAESEKKIQRMIGSDRLPVGGKHSSVVLGAGFFKVDVVVPVPSSGNGGTSLFLPKSQTELPLRLKFTDKSSNNPSKFPIEPISWNEILPSESGPTLGNHAIKKSGVPKSKSKSTNKLESADKNKSFISLVSKTKGHKTALPRVTMMDKHHVASNYLHGTGHHGEKSLRRKLHTSHHSDTSSDDTPTRPIPAMKDISRRLEPLTVEDVAARNRLSVKLSSSDLRFQFDEAKHIRDRIKSPSRGYWSDNDTSLNLKKKTNEMNLTHLQTFKKAHRPSKPLHGESPLASEQIFIDGPLNGKKYFFPTQTRTQRSHLPKSVLRDRRLDIFLPDDFRQNSVKKITKRHTSFRQLTSQHPFGINSPKSTKTYIVNRNSSNSFTGSLSQYSSSLKTEMPEHQGSPPYHFTLGESRGDHV